MRLLLIGFFALTAFRNLQQPGLYGDEAWTPVQPARLYLGLPSTGSARLQSIHIFGHTLPFMPNDYIGPVQSYIFFFAFVLLGLSVQVIRITTSVLGLLGVLCFHAFARLHFGALTAALASLLLATDLSYLLLTRHDFGVISFCLFAQCAGLWLLSRWSRNRTGTPLFLGAFVLGLGFTQRINFLAFIVAVGASALLACGRRIQPTRREACLAGLGFLTGAWPALIYNVVTHGAALTREKLIASATARPEIPRSLPDLVRWLEALPAALAQRITTARLLFDGSSVANYILGDQVRSAPPFHGSFLGIAFLIAIPILIAGFFFETPSWRRSVVFSVGVSALTFLFVTLIPIASGPHHVAAIYPFPELFVGLAIALLWSARPLTATWRRVARVAAAASFVLIFTSNLWLGFVFHARLARNGGSGFWTEASTDLANVLRTKYRDRTVEIMDWGIDEPLLVLGQGQIRCKTPFWQLMGSPQPVQDLAPLLRAPGQVFVLRSEPFAFSEKVHAAFFQAARQDPKWQPTQKKLFQRNGALAFLILEPQPFDVGPYEAASVETPVLDQLIPSSTLAGESFNTQPSGEAAIAVRGNRFTADSIVVLDRQELTTAYGNPNLLTALVPREFYSRPGHLAFSVRNRHGESDMLPFIVQPRPQNWLQRMLE